MNDEYLIYGETLKAIADSIRSVSSVSTTWTPDEMAAYILANLVKPTTRQAAKTYTPGTSNQTIPAGTFLTGAATIAGDADLAAANIKKGVNIFGKTGTLDGIFGTPGSFYGFTKVKSGSFTNTAVKIDHTVTHGLGVVPKLVWIYSENIDRYSMYASYTSAMAFQTCSDTYFSSGGKTTSGVFIWAIAGTTYSGFFGGSELISPTSPARYQVYTMTRADLTDSYRNSYNIIRAANSNTFHLLADGDYYLGVGTYKWLAMA